MVYGLFNALPWYVNVSVRFHVPLECRVWWQALLLCLVFRVRLEPTYSVPERSIRMRSKKVTSKIAGTRFSLCTRALSVYNKSYHMKFPQRACDLVLTTSITISITRLSIKWTTIVLFIYFLRYITSLNHAASKVHDEPRFSSDCTIHNSDDRRSTWFSKVYDRLRLAGRIILRFFESAAPFRAEGVGSPRTRHPVTRPRIRRMQRDQPTRLMHCRTSPM